MNDFASKLVELSKLLAQEINDPNNNLNEIAIRLASLWTKKLVKANHTVMELVCASFLVGQGFHVSVEYEINDSLVCDIYAMRDGISLIVEIETGFVPPEASFDPLLYRVSRIVSKIARYSVYSDIFILATPPYHILQIPKFFIRPINERKLEELKVLKALCDKYYKRPPIPSEQILEGRVDAIYLVDVDNRGVKELTLSEYYDVFVRKEVELLGDIPLL